MLADDERSFMKYFAVLPLLLLAACVPPPSPHVTAETDEFSPYITLNGPFSSDTEWSAGFYKWQLKSLITRATPHQVTHSLLLGVQYTGHLDPFTQAFDDHAMELPIVMLHKEKGTCHWRECGIGEEAGVILQESYLRQHVASGFRVKAITRDGNWYILSVTPEMIHLQLDATDKYTH